MRRSKWNGFESIDFDFKGRNATLVFPEKPCDHNKWLLKTVYFGAFPDFEIEMLKRGYHLAYVDCKTRWHDESDADIKAEFCKFLTNEYGLCDKCLPVGMSCGGMHAIYFAAKYPELTSALYLDAPVVNLLSCPAGVGDATDEMYEEFVRDTGMTKSFLINYRNHPADNLAAIAENKIPVFLICGDNDNIVPYHENGKIVYDYFSSRGLKIEQIIKSGCGHHPHGLEDNTPLINFVIQNY